MNVGANEEYWFTLLCPVRGSFVAIIGKEANFFLFSPPFSRGGPRVPEKGQAVGGMYPSLVVPIYTKTFPSWLHAASNLFFPS